MKVKLGCLWPQEKKTAAAVTDKKKKPVFTVLLCGSEIPVSTLVPTCFLKYFFIYVDFGTGLGDIQQ